MLNSSSPVTPDHNTLPQRIKTAAAALIIEGRSHEARAALAEVFEEAGLTGVPAVRPIPFIELKSGFLNLAQVARVDRDGSVLSVYTTDGTRYGYTGEDAEIVQASLRTHILASVTY